MKAVEEHQISTLFSPTFQKYLREIVYGGVDGCITTFAVVAGAAGANMESSIIIILGFANLLADGFSMSVGSYLSASSEKDNYEKHKRIEYQQIKSTPESEIEEVRNIYRQKGFEGQMLEDIVRTITSDKDRWVDLMMKEELEMIPENKSPLAMGMATFLSFICLGFIPLFLYVVDFIYPLHINLFFLSSVLTGLVFIAIGWIKSYVTQSSKSKSIVETTLLGISAASVSYVVGTLLEK